ncbi:MAG: helix-turn-helix transcriptional regulator [Gordonia sp. (in: high G+C Gram-positive bacteria)]|uniref:helix-turn-helix domain-containing protein n=1 Tax=Gordonia sp. (in: high G+C Gram-positive bacteria) TaxID=84139 RepID=UPI0039E573CE
MPLPELPTSQEEIDRRRAHRLAFGDVLRRARADAGISQTVLADFAEVSRPTIARIENGTHSVSLDRLWAISAALGVSAHELIARTEHLANDRLVAMRRSPSSTQ